MSVAMARSAAHKETRGRAVRRSRTPQFKCGTVRLGVLETPPLSQPASFQYGLRHCSPSLPISKDWKLEKFRFAARGGGPRYPPYSRSTCLYQDRTPAVISGCALAGVPVRWSTSETCAMGRWVHGAGGADAGEEPAREPEGCQTCVISLFDQGRLFLRLRRAVLETEGPRPSQPVSNIQLETGPKSSAEFPKPGF